MMPAHIVTFGPYVFDSRQGVLLRSGLPVALGAKGQALLRALLEADGEVVTKSQLIDTAWPKTNVEESNLTVQIAALRKILGESANGEEWIATVPRTGYRLVRSIPLRHSNIDSVADALVLRTTRLNPSIAVLPFKNLSDDPEQEHFGGGLAEDLITDLSKVPGLLVIAPHSSFAYKSRPADIASISTDFNVRYLIAGSVRCAAARVRICAQIIDAVDNSHLWAERFDRNLADVFAVQDEIVGRIVSALLGLLPSTLPAPRQPAGNLEARREPFRPPLAWRFNRSACRFLGTRASMQPLRHGTDRQHFHRPLEGQPPAAGEVRLAGVLRWRGG